ncbi:hypothetical protein ACFL0W_02620 [Nanoarchaeota archaeon]
MKKSASTKSKGKKSKKESKAEEHLKEIAKEEKEKLKKEQKKDSETKKDSIFWLVIIVVFLTAAMIFFITYKNKEEISVAELHKLLIQGKLDEDEGYLYNGFSFVKKSDLWHTYLVDNYGETYNIQLRHGPKEVETIKTQGDLRTFFRILDSPAVYITFDPEGSQFPHIALAAAELSQNLAKVFEVNPVAACTTNSTGICEERPTITCDDPYPTIFFKESLTPSVIREDDCIIIHGVEEDIVKAEERLIYGWYKIIPFE